MKIEIKGTIVNNDDKWIYDWFEMSAISPKDVINQIALAKFNEQIDVEINSGGGDLYAGAEIYTALKDYKGTVTTKIVGIAASAASLVAMAGEKIMMSPPAQLMIHNAAAQVYGNKNVLSDMIPLLNGHDEGLAYVYMQKTGMTQEETMSLMDAETYMNSKDALEKGFIDEIMFQEDLKISASVSNVLPVEIINKIRNLIKNENGADNPQPTSEYITSQKKEFSRIKNKMMEVLAK